MCQPSDACLGTWSPMPSANLNISLLNVFVSRISRYELREAPSAFLSLPASPNAPTVQTAGRLTETRQRQGRLPPPSHAWGLSKQGVLCRRHGKSVRP